MNCPTCDRPAVRNCKCPCRSSECAQGHKWHTCSVHKTTVLRAADHTKAYGLCSCLPPSPNPVDTKPSFTNDDLELLRESAAMMMCWLETGEPHLTRDDLRRQGKEPPAFDFPRLEKADRARKLWTKLLAYPWGS